MALNNSFPSWGETGTLPPDGFFYEGGDQPNEKHYDALWHQLDQHFQAIADEALTSDGSVQIQNGATAVPFSDDAGAETLADMAVTSGPAAGTEESYSFSIDGTTIFKAYAEADGAGAIQNPSMEMLQNLDVNGNTLRVRNTNIGNDLQFGGSQIYDTQSGAIVRTATDPTSGEPILRILSSGGSERLRVEHSGITSTSNSEFHVGGNPAVVSSTGTAYDIQKNGTDAVGVINFKT